MTAKPGKTVVVQLRLPPDLVEWIDLRARVLGLAERRRGCDPGPRALFLSRLLEEDRAKQSAKASQGEG